MRRKDREITDIDEIIEIVKKCDVCNLALFDEQYPYIVPLNFGMTYENKSLALYFHSANVGKKLELIKKNNRVAFELNCSHRLLLGEKACNSTMEYESVCGNGIINTINEDEKLNALIAIMKQYSKNREYEFDKNEVKAVTVLRLSVNEITAKRLKRL